MRTHRPSVYDQLRPHLDAADVIRRLDLHVSRSIGSEALLRPLCHESVGGESLQVNLHTGRWNCKACQHRGVHGDLFQLVEYALSGGAPPTHGRGQRDSDAHRRALLWLCQQHGVHYDEGRIERDAALDVVHMVSMLAHEQLLSSSDVLDWIDERWGFDRSTVESYGIGYLPSPIPPPLAAEANAPSSRTAFRSSGVGFYPPDGRWRTRFEGRVTFPYLEHGRAVYLIGRSTPWTPRLDGDRPPPKYHKLSVHSDRRPYVSESITNDHLYNETVLSTCDSVVVAEGVADAVALSSIGVPVVSPVTISFNRVDLERFLRRARENRIREVDILFDNELSGSGNHAARRVAAKLCEAGIVARVLTIPLGAAQETARDEVASALGAEAFAEFERADPSERKRVLEREVIDEARRAWVSENVAASKVDAAEWIAGLGAGAAEAFERVRREGMDAVEMAVEDVGGVDPDESAARRISAYEDAIRMSAHVDDRVTRGSHASTISGAAGRGVTKADVAAAIARVRRDEVLPARREAVARDDAPAKVDAERGLVVLPPESEHVQPSAPPPPIRPTDPKAPPAPPPPKPKVESPHDRYQRAREAVARAVEAKTSEDVVGRYVAQTIVLSMGYTPFRTADEMYLVRGSEKVAVGLARWTAAFESLLYMASGLSQRRSSHRPHAAATVYHLELESRRVPDVSWSHVDRERSVYFPTGDDAGRILRIAPGEVSQTRMSEARVPAVAGDEFEPFRYVEENGGIARTEEVMRWTSLSPGDRMILVHWIACLPILRRVGTIPIVRIEGGSSSGKTRAVGAVSHLVNGRQSSSVPTAAALVSRMSTEMLTIDDNREARDVTHAFLGTLLQATHLGAREKRASNSDTGTVIERICGALLMNGIEPIHDGQSEVASRFLTLRCSEDHRADDSPAAEETLFEAVVECRDAFWSESVRRCAVALELDAIHGERIGGAIEALFNETRIGRLASYLRLMVLAWIAGRSEGEREALLARDELPAPWAAAFAEIGGAALDSLLAEELAVSVVRYAFAHGAEVAEPTYAGSPTRAAFGTGGYLEDVETGVATLGPMRASRLARIARAAGKELNAPRAVATDLRAGQLERRLLDGVAFLESAGFEVEVTRTRRGAWRFALGRRSEDASEVPPPPPSGGGDTWTGP